MPQCRNGPGTRVGSFEPVRAGAVEVTRVGGRDSTGYACLERAVSPVGSRDETYDNALAESVNGLYKAELIARHGPWRSVEQVELATARWVEFWNHLRLHRACGDIPPAEFEAANHRRQATGAAACNPISWDY